MPGLGPRERDLEINKAYSIQGPHSLVRQVIICITYLYILYMYEHACIS